MIAKDYLKRAYLLDKQINVEIQELESLKSMRGQVQGVFYGERIGQKNFSSLVVEVKLVNEIVACF